MNANNLKMLKRKFDAMNFEHQLRGAIKSAERQTGATFAKIKA